MLETSTFEENLRAIVGPENLRAGADADVVCGVLPQFVAEPKDEKQLAAALSIANEAGFSVVPRGGGTKLDWGNPPKKADLVLSTVRLNQIVEHVWADLTVTVEAGCTLKSLQKKLAQHGQRLALDALWPERATIGGMLSTNDSGALRLRFGALRDLIIGVTIALPDGTLASSGGKVVKNVAGYDLPKLVTGALGTLGVITRAVFRLHPLPRSKRACSITAANAEEAQRIVLAIQDSKLAHTFLQSHFSDDATPTSDILFEGTEAGLTAQEAQLRKLCGAARVSEASTATWAAREELWSFSEPSTTAIAKISILPGDLARTIGGVERTAKLHQLRWRALAYATGIAWVRLEGRPGGLPGALQLLRVELENQGGSLAALHRPEKMAEFDAS